LLETGKGQRKKEQEYGRCHPPPKIPKTIHLNLSLDKEKFTKKPAKAHWPPQVSLQIL
jgi:hypothetical protein